MNSFRHNRMRLAALLLVFVLACASVSELSGELVILEEREMTEQEELWWEELIDCLVDRMRITETQADTLSKPLIIIASGNLEPLCKDDDAVACAMGCELVIHESRRFNKTVFKHEFQHCIEWQVSGRLSHESDWWRWKGRCF